ncbi:MAG TPA: TonB-dependent receptor [Rhizomicrobium sp.]
MRKFTNFVFVAGFAFVASAASGKEFDIPGGSLGSALNAYGKETGVQLIYSGDAIKGVHTKGVKGDLSADDALSRLLSGTGFISRRESGGIVVRRDLSALQQDQASGIDVAAATAPSASGVALETVTVTSSKIGGDVQNIPISITALSQEQLTATQTAGGPDLVKQVPNMTFTKTNFTGYSIQIRGIGTQAISVTTDPAVAVAFNDIPFIRNHFFEQEFYDVSQVEVARGPQGTLYGRNATAGVVNLVSAKPSDQFEAMASADIGNYQNRRLEGMINIPIADDRFDLRVAGEWTKRDGYSFNSYTDASIDGRDLWSSRVTLGMKPMEHLQTYLVWEHFSEDDDRLRSAKQLCKTDYGPGGTPTNGSIDINGTIMTIGPGFGLDGPGDNGNFFLQGCVPTSLYSKDAFQAPLGYALPYVMLIGAGNPYTSETQSSNLRVINSNLNPAYRAKNDTLEFNADYNLTPSLTLTSQTGYNRDSLWSTEDFNRFGAIDGFFGTDGNGNNNVFCDPQLGCADRLVVEDLSDEQSWQLSQEFRLNSNFGGPLNFSVGANYLHYETLENYYVFINAVSDWVSSQHLDTGYLYLSPGYGRLSYGNVYTDPTPLSNLAGDGHNYYRNTNPYVLNSYAGFGEVNYSVLSDLKLTTGLRWTEDRKHFLLVPSWISTDGYGYPVSGVIDQQWNQLTGRAVANWTPKLDFTDQTLIYGSYAHGYKAGGANPPGAVFDDQGSLNPVHPLTFKPEFVDAFEIGTKNTLFDGAMTLNGDLFYYNYENYQISEIVDRTAINLNFDAHAKGAELEATWEPIPGLKFNFAGGWEDTEIAKGQSSVDLMDRTAGHAGWYISKPFISQASNCIFPGYVAQYLLHGGGYSPGPSACELAYVAGDDPLTGVAYVPNPTVCNDYTEGEHGECPPNYLGFDPLAGTPGDPYHGQNTGNLCVQNCDGEGNPVYSSYDYGPAPNDGQGFSKNVGGDKLPNAPPYTISAGAQYTMPLSQDWAGTLRGDFYWQDSSWWRVFDDNPYDRLHGYNTVNLTLIFTNQNGWQVMFYDKNVFNVTAITGAFLNSDDTGLTTNVFLTDPKLIGIRVTKNW